MSSQKLKESKKVKRRREQVDPHHLPLIDRQMSFEEVNLGYLRQDEVFVEAKRCFSCRKPQCVQACPANFDIRTMLMNLHEGKFKEAADVVNNFYCFSESFNRICPAFCQSACIAGKKGDPINILNIKRYLSENFMKPHDYYDREDSKGIKVAIIGSGPAGLTAAHTLAKIGYDVTIFEKHQRKGGMLAIGIPEYRLPEKVLNREINDLRNFGIKFRTGIAFGSDVTVDDLEKEGFKSILISHGAHQPKWMGIEGEEDIQGVVHAIQFLRDIALDNPIDIGDNVAIVGGGDVAIDAARTVLRLGKKPIILYRRTKEEMPATKEEIEETEKEKIPIHFLRNPVRVVGNEKVKGVELVKMQLGEPDESGRRRPEPISGSNYILPIDNLIIAISQEPEAVLSDVELTKWNTFKVGKASYMTDIPGIFAAGDNVSGPKTAIEAIVQGKEAAEEINEYLLSKKRKTYVKLDILENVYLPN